MEKQSKILIVLLIVFLICVGVFWFQFNNNVSTFMIVNETHVTENSSFSGMLVDSYGNGVANQTIAYHEPGGNVGTLTTDENGEFTVELAKYLSNSTSDNYYGDFKFSGNGKYQGCAYEGNVTVGI
ncbi:hypothetical protein SAMN05216439_1033 [Methanobrevibacter gottschalkii]|uniref:Carboxypeptidase family protein n=2 Tax=Methanobrevibacter gottschalkii TaxID=190974 RepID=A0A3N5BM72_9EURY|nr:MULTISPECIES: Ig-like domain-containing protein [Methanobrevibacter]MCQ2971176.1 Ig-like domain-containing protein [archaeon]OED00595.1 hypothetical protein A9505_02695 [Methanobrevibacter sp. A27]RPF50788.1 hypothetical protein EDC42_1443 [Methanobrevibacter gottschalkii DSM 11977]SEK48631.1 hypothetical protein SAMN05216439_1033 [Methanobrevibacter gottschalkii]